MVERNLTPKAFAALSPARQQQLVAEDARKHPKRYLRECFRWYLACRNEENVWKHYAAPCPPREAGHSHSIVAGGFDEMSYTTRLTPRTSLMIRFATRDSRSCGKRDQWAVMKSSVSTARKATTYS